MFCTSVRRADAPPAGGSRGLEFGAGVSSSVGAGMPSLLPPQMARAAGFAILRRREGGTGDRPGTTRGRARRCDRCSTPPSPRPTRAWCWPQICRPGRAGRCMVVGGGKSAAVMAAALEDAWPESPSPASWSRATAMPCRRAASRCSKPPIPFPTPTARPGARRLLERVRGLTADDLVLALISGGGSALLPLPAPGLTLADNRRSTARCWLRVPPLPK